MKNQPLIVIVGETASGKSALAMVLAKKFQGEIISADSWTVYKGFDIGTAKPSKEKQKLIRHHLLDIADPKDGFSVVEFKKQAEKAITDITGRDKLPIMAGGTGLYIDSVLYNYGFLPAGGAKQRRELNNLSLAELQNRVKNEGLNTDGIDTRNKRRLIRLLETEGERPKRAKLRPNTLIIGLETPRQRLKQRITHRVDAMLKQGLEDEVKDLAKTYGWDIEPMKGIGYREWCGYFEGGQTLEQTRDRIISSTMQLAKKQRTWFKRNKSIQTGLDLNETVEIATTFLNKIQ